MKYPIKKLLIESQITDMVRNELSRSLNNHNILSAKFEKLHKNEMDQIEARDKSQDITQKPVQQELSESIVSTKNKLLQIGKIDPAKISKASIQKINHEGMNQQIMNDSKKNSDAYAARSITGGNAANKIVTEAVDISNNALTKKPQVIPNYHDEKVGTIGHRPILGIGNKILRKETKGPNGNRLGVPNGEGSYEFKGVSDLTAKQDKYKK